MGTKARNHQALNNLSFDMEEVPMLGVQSPTPACLFVDMLNGIYDLELEYRTEVHLQMPDERPIGVPRHVDAGMYMYYDNDFRMLYILVQMPHFQVEQSHQLFSTDPILNYNKLLFLHGESAFERMEWLRNDLVNRPKPREIDICDYRTWQRLQRRNEFYRDHVTDLRLFDFRPPKGNDNEDPWLNMVVIKKKGDKVVKPAAGPKMKGVTDPMAQLGQRLLSCADTYFCEIDRQERQLKERLLET